MVDLQAAALSKLDQLKENFFNYIVPESFPNNRHFITMTKK